MQNLNFEGRGSEYFTIWIVNVLLTILTLGIYYPWAKVRSHRYFYGNSTLEGRNFDYHATGKDIFIGYLISLALFIAYVVIQYISFIGSFVVLFLFLVALPWIIWRSLLFNMRVTSFSNVRFGFDGLLPQAYINFLVLPIAILLTLYLMPLGVSIALPLMGFTMNAGTGLLIAIVVILSWLAAFYLLALIKKRNTAYTIGHSRYGQGRFAVDVQTGFFAKILFKAFGLAILGFIIYLIFMSIAVKLAIGDGGFALLNNVMTISEDPSIIFTVLGSSIVLIVALIYGGLIIGLMSIMAYIYTRQRTYILANTTLDEKITLQSTLKARSLAWVMISNFFLIIFTLALAFPWAKVRMARLMLENTLVNTDQGFDNYINQQQKDQSPLGDQLGDAFDIDAGIAI
ncbi:MAG: DUF898 domain-containing protein [Cellvibrionaceae bacterium]|nr:DUF898 domain-containing protein [Cellvibrionaceae bacterium]